MNVRTRKYKKMYEQNPVFFHQYLIRRNIDKATRIKILDRLLIIEFERWKEGNV